MICVITAGDRLRPVGTSRPGGGGSVGGFATYMMGTTLVLIFLIALAILRLSCDQLVPNNMNFEPRTNWAGATLCGPVGAFLGVGILAIGVGMLQFKAGGLNYRGWARRHDRNPQPLLEPFDDPRAGTARFYEFLSVGSLSPMMNPDRSRSSTRRSRP